MLNKVYCYSARSLSFSHYISAFVVCSRLQTQYFGFAQFQQNHKFLQFTVSLQSLFNWTSLWWNWRPHSSIQSLHDFTKAFFCVIVVAKTKNTFAFWEFEEKLFELVKLQAEGFPLRHICNEFLWELWSWATRMNKRQAECNGVTWCISTQIYG